MTQSLLELAKELTRSLVESGKLSAENMQETFSRRIQPSARSKTRKSPAPLPRSPLPTHHRWTGERASANMPLPAWNAGSPSNSCPSAIWGCTDWMAAHTG